MPVMPTPDDVKIRELQERLDKERGARLVAEEKLKLSGKEDSQLVVDLMRSRQAYAELYERHETMAERIRCADGPVDELQRRLAGKDERIAELEAHLGRLYAEGQKGKARK